MICSQMDRPATCHSRVTWQPARQDQRYSGALPSISIRFWQKSGMRKLTTLTFSSHVFYQFALGIYVVERRKLIWLTLNQAISRVELEAIRHFRAFGTSHERHSYTVQSIQ